MSVKNFDLAGLAAYLKRDVRELEKLAAQGKLPGRRVAGQWRFHRDEVNEWLERQMPAFTDRQLESVEFGVGHGGNADGQLDLLVASLLRPSTIEIPLQARTATSVLKRLVELANQTWQLFLPDEVLRAIRDRESLLSTAMPGGVAIPHPRRPMPQALGESVIAFGRTSAGIPFGGDHGQLTDLFFLVLCRDDRSHLQVLARLARMMQRAEFLLELRNAQCADAAIALVQKVESSVVC